MFKETKNAQGIHYSIYVSLFSLEYAKKKKYRVLKFFMGVRNCINESYHN